jgi:excisionase family DNA binding protein
MADRLMSTSELAEYLNVPVSRVHDCWRAWGIPAIRVGTTLRFRRNDVDRWLEGQREAL